MAGTIAVDASVLVRYLTGDDSVQSPAAAKLFKGAQSGRFKLIIPVSALQESVYVLETYYQLGGDEIGSKLISVLAIPNVETPDSRWVIEALHAYRTRNCDFGDALLCCFANAAGHEVATFDKGIPKKFPEVASRTPAEII